MVDQDKFEHLLPLACQWATEYEKFILERGTSLGPAFAADAQLVGVQNCDRVRMLIVDRIPLPEDEQLAAAARRSQIVTKDSRAMTIGYGILIRADCWGDRELVLHQLVHVAQCERAGGLQPYLQEYLSQRRTCATFTVGSFEEEARGIAREICAVGSTS